MSLSTLTAILLAVAVAWSSVQLLRHAFSATKTPRGLRLLALLVFQAASAVLLWFTLFPPATHSSSGTLVVLTAGATPSQLAAAAGTRVFALPEAPRLAGSEAVPDLASALRRYPRARQLHVIGAGLPMRDQAAASGWPLRFDAEPLPRGLVELWSPRQVRGGARWTVSGRVEGVPGGRVELHDPGEVPVARAALDGQGRFAMEAGARSVGRAEFSLRVLDSKGKAVEKVEVPLDVVAGAPLRAQLLAGGVGPELKYLRRWASDAGVQLQSAMSVGPGVRIGAATAVPDAAALRALDLLVLDERAWKELGEQGRATLAQAVREGLGLLLLVTGPVTGEEHAALRALGFTLADADIARTVALAGAAAQVAESSAQSVGDAGLENAPASLPRLARRPLAVVAEDAAALLRDDKGAALATWRAEGEGRIGLWWLTDSYRLVLAGHADLHGTLWSHAFATLARPRDAAEPELRTSDPRAGERLVLCRLPVAARVVDPAGTEIPLLTDPPGDPSACAAYWPRAAGWHELRGDGVALQFRVRAADEATGLAAQAMREATASLAAQPAAAGAAHAESGRGTPWRWFFAWLAASSLLWWLERSRPRAEVVAPRAP